MQIPSAFETILKTDQALHAAVLHAITRTEAWLNAIPLAVFFPEYTQHDNDHNEQVLHTAAELMSEHALEQVSPQDIAVLICAVLLHDSAMRISETGFKHLISGDGPWVGVAPFDRKSWPQAWQDYLSEARRFDQTALNNIFGDSLPGAQVPPEDPQDWTARDRMLIGEFIRRHHARLAHEIALHGVPGDPKGSYPVFFDDTGSDLPDWAGLVARSHGMNLRDCFGYLEGTYDLREWQGIHGIYLMGVLRIADYLQIQKERAPERTMALTRIRSPLSAQEWKVHQCVRNITIHDAAPEAILIQAAPEDAQTFVRLRQWLEDLQRELDLTWAVLGEVYRRDERLNKLDLKLRRIKFRTDRKEGFAEIDDYLSKGKHTYNSNTAIDSQIGSQSDEFFLVENFNNTTKSYIINDLFNKLISELRKTNPFDSQRASIINNNMNVLGKILSETNDPKEVLFRKYLNLLREEIEILSINNSRREDNDNEPAFRVLSNQLLSRLKDSESLNNKRISIIIKSISLAKSCFTGTNDNTKMQINDYLTILYGEFEKILIIQKNTECLFTNLDQVLDSSIAVIEAILERKELLRSKNALDESTEQVFEDTKSALHELIIIRNDARNATKAAK